MNAYYNEVDPYAAQWLRNLVAARLIPAGDVDERSIADVRPGDLRGYGQCHFFAGIAGWPLALDLAGWGEREAWTGSCPCQPLSSAGQRRAHADERHLWPAFYALIAECRPATVFGEQVAGALGREWLAGVRADLEAAGYAVGAADLCAAGVGAPHNRQRLFWVADAECDDGKRNAGALERTARDGPVNAAQDRSSRRQNGGARPAPETRGRGPTGRLADAEHDDRRTNLARREPQGRTLDGWSSAVWQEPDRPGRLGDAAHEGLVGCDGPARTPAIGLVSELSDNWSSAVWLPCLDGKARRVEPSIFPLAHAGEWGAGSRVGLLRGAGNAVVPAVAAAFVAAFLEARP
jgi:DNA (cytosine-5)-methyltransferase 1